MQNLPYELVAIIFDELSRYDLKSLSLVSKYLNTVANTRLFRTISVPKPFVLSSMDPIMLQSPKLIENTCNLNIKVRQNNSFVYQISLYYISQMKNLRSIKVDLKDISDRKDNLLEYLPRSTTAENLILHLNSLLDTSVKMLFSQNFLGQYPNLKAMILIFRDKRCICQFREALEAIFTTFDSSDVKDIFVVLKVDDFNEIGMVKPVLQVTQPYKNNMQVYTKQQSSYKHAQMAL